METLTNFRVKENSTISDFIQNKSQLIIEELWIFNKSDYLHYASMNLKLNLLKSSNLSLDNDSNVGKKNSMKE